MKGTHPINHGVNHGLRGYYRWKVICNTINMEKKIIGLLPYLHMFDLIIFYLLTGLSAVLLHLMMFINPTSDFES
jgi:hypothetical protein